MVENPVLQLDMLKASLGPLPEAAVRPPLIVVSGLPGTGKSFFCRQLLNRLPAVRVESDALRKVLFPRPSYSAEESARLFGLLHRLVDGLLQEGIGVVFDATNLSERNREYLHHLAQRRGARLILVRVEAPAEVVRERLQGRGSGADPEDPSDANWEVYRRLRRGAQPIRHSHFAVDTSRDIAPVIEKIVREANR